MTMMHVYFHSLYFAYFSADFQYVGFKRMEICYSTNEIKYVVVYPS